MQHLLNMKKGWACLNCTELWRLFRDLKSLVITELNSPSSLQKLQSNSLIMWGTQGIVKVTYFIWEGNSSNCTQSTLRVGTTITCIILIVNLPSEQEGMDQFMREKNIIMQSHHRIYTDESPQHDHTSQTRSVKFWTCHCWSDTSCLLSCSLFYSIYGLLANTGGIVISCDSGVPKMLGRTPKKAKNGRKWEVGGGRKRIKRRKYQHRWMAWDRVSY